MLCGCVSHHFLSGCCGYPVSIHICSVFVVVTFCVEYKMPLTLLELLELSLECQPIVHIVEVREQRVFAENQQQIDNVDRSKDNQINFSEYEPHEDYREEVDDQHQVANQGSDVLGGRIYLLQFYLLGLWPVWV